MLLGRLAVDCEHQGRGLASALLEHFLLKALEGGRPDRTPSGTRPCQGLERSRFYRRWGFEPSPIDDFTLMLLIKDIRP